MHCAQLGSALGQLLPLPLLGLFAGQCLAVAREVQADPPPLEGRQESWGLTISPFGPG